MNFVAWQMLTGDRAKYLGLVFAIAFSTFLMSHQTSIFCGLMNRTRSQITDVRDAAIWVMDPKTQYLDEVKALPDQDLYRVRGVDAVDWAVPLFKGTARARVHSDGKFRAVILLGIDDASLVGAPRDMALGSFDALRMPDSIVLDQVGYKFFFPGEPLRLGKQVEMNDRILRVVGICNSSAPFVNLPVAYTRYSIAVELVGQERNLMSFRRRETQSGGDGSGSSSTHHKRDGVARGDRFGVRMGNHLVLRPEHRHPDQLRHHGSDRAHSRNSGYGADLLPVCARKSEAVRSAQSNRSDELANYRNDSAASARGRRGRLLPRNRDDGCFL
jgi:hypothetical protein